MQFTHNQMRRRVEAFMMNNSERNTFTILNGHILDTRFFKNQISVRLNQH